MITYEHGRWRSQLTAAEQRSATLDSVERLTTAERAGLALVLGEYETTGTSSTANEVTEFEWDEVPLPIEDWLQSEYHVGETGKDLYPILRKDMCELFHVGALQKNGYAEAVFTGAIGWGKDYLATFCTMRMLYELLCLKNPQHTLGMGAGEPIHIVPISRTVAQAKRVVFGGLCKKLNLAAWFRGKFIETMEEVRFKEKGIYIVGGASQDASALGLNVICALVDECVTEDTLILTPDGYHPVSDLYDSSANDQLTFGPIVSYDEKTGLGRVDGGFIRPASETEVFEVELDDGRTITTTARHPFMVRRPWSDLDYVFIKDLKPGDEVVVVHDAETVEALRGDQAKDQAGQPANEGAQGWDRRGLVPGRCTGGLGSPRAGTDAAWRVEAREAWRKEAGAENGGVQAQGVSGEHQDQGGSIGNRHNGCSRFQPAGVREQGAAQTEGGRQLQEAEREQQAADDDARAAGWHVATHEESVAGSCLPGPDDRYQASLFPYAGGEGEDCGGEPQAEGRVQTQRGDQEEDQRELGLASEERGFQLPTPLRFEEGPAEAGADLVGSAVAVGEARSTALGRGLCRSQFPVRTIGRALHLGGEEATHVAGLPGDDDGLVDGNDRGEAEGLCLQRQGTRQGRRLLRLLRAAGMEIRSVGRATAVARVVAIRSKGCRRTFDVMSLPGGNFVANGVVVHNSNFMGEGKVTTGSASSENYDKATMIYNALARRVKSRFQRHGVSGLVFLISSKRATSDFTERHLRQAMKDDDPTVFVRDYPVWEVNPEPFEGQKWHRVMVSPKTGRSRCLAEGEEVEEDDETLILRYPDDFHQEFVNDTDGSVRDFGGIATDFAGRLFIARRTAIDEMIDAGRPQWFKAQEWRTDRLLRIDWAAFMDRDARDDPICICCPKSLRHIHIDLSQNHCATGFCMGHICGSVEVKRRDPDTGEEHRENAPMIHIDCVLRIVAADGGDVDHSEVRALVYRLQSKGVPIRSVSMDQYMAPSNLQIFKKRGLRVLEIGERRFKMKPYIATRQAIYEQRLVCPSADALVAELKGLEISADGRKVTKPARGCFTADTRVRLLDGRSLTFTELVDEFGDDRAFHVYTVRDGKVDVGVARSPRLTGRDVELVAVTLDDGSVVRCTPDHRFMLRDGSYREAGQLAAGDSLMPLYTRISKRREHGGMDGYELYLGLVDGKRHFTHRMVGRWRYPGYTGNQYGTGLIHHELGKRNNDPFALTLCGDAAEHGRLHREDMLRRRADPEFEAKRIAALKRYNDDPANRAAASRRLKETMSRPENYDKVMKALAPLRAENGRKNIVRYNKSEKHRTVAARVGRQTIKKAHEAVRRRDVTIEVVIGLRGDGLTNPAIADELKCSISLVESRFLAARKLAIQVPSAPAHVTARRRASSTRARRDVTIEAIVALRADGFTMVQIAERLCCSAGLVNARITVARRAGVLVPGNHKVVAVRPAGRADVYDLTVEGTHNFALDAGVFVHNSKDLADALSGVVYYMNENMRAGAALAPSLGTSVGSRGPGPQWGADGEVEWGDEVAPSLAQNARKNSSEDGEEGYSLWIISG